MPEVIGFLVVFLGIAIFAIAMSAKEQEKKKQDFKKRSDAWREDFNFLNRGSGSNSAQQPQHAYRPVHPANKPALAAKAKPAQDVYTPMTASTLQTLGSTLDLNKHIQSDLKSRLGVMDDHMHAGDAVEERPDMYGSLGEVTDEGCFNHANIRFLTQTEMQNDEDEQTFDTESLVSAIVFGDVLNARRG